MSPSIDPHSAEALVDRYLACHASTDLDGVLSLFAVDAVVEDPVGAPVLHGRSEIREFYRATHAGNGPLVFERIGRVLVGGDEIALHVRARLARDLDGAGMDVIYLLRVDEGGRIRSLRAFF
jgi:steroid delta-isomerase